MTAKHFIVLFCRVAPHSLTPSLEAAGYVVFEALAFSEALHLCEHENISYVLLAPDVEDAAAREMSWHYPTLRFRPETPTDDLLIELAALL
jgi:hypothetical protein